eukprot:TRINITY_DN1455_c0_g1_i1.p1 TRINITY_DN1455_c0_g1~~TRINITY_DN1455_c0_g1_i1.p1  ORF type:complete len:618 (+),score=158.76 TRINITY_DN1455_c0_g1_i1:238-2091(+)
MPFVAQPTEKCTACAKTVYATEKVVVDDKETKRVYHKTCIRCKECNKVLGLGQYSALEGTFYCKPHFKQLFHSKGNYDEAFGKEKASGKWAPQVVSPPASFLPSEEKPAESKDEKKQSSAETVARFRKFREDGEEDKCLSCGKTVYAAEKLLVENKNDKQLFHKSCFRCHTCEIILDLRNYGSADGHVYCKNHLKDVTATSRPAATAVVQPTSFIPATETEERKPAEKNETSEAVSAKFKKFREEGEQDKCQCCGKTVYAAEKLLVEDRSEKRLFHKTCFRCSVCDITVDLRNYGSIDGTIYCKNHLKEKERDRAGSAGPAYVTRPASFVPEASSDKPQAKSSTPDHIAAKFKGLGSAEKCKACGKSVYATEKMTVEELTEKSVYHKNCLRCKVCDVKLDLGTFGSSGGVIYCKPHLKQFGRPEQVRSENAFFISPLADKDGNYTPGTADEERVSQQEDGDDAPRENSLRESSPRESREEAVDAEVTEAVETQKEESEAVVSQGLEVHSDNSSRDLSYSSSSESESERAKREQRNKERDDEDRKYEEEKAEREREREARRKQREDEDRKEDEERERRKKEREDRRKQQEEDNKREEEEMARRAEERRKRLDALKEDN